MSHRLYVQRFLNRYLKIKNIENKEDKKKLELFKELMREYEFEYHRSEKLDEKAMHLGTSAGTLFTFFLGFILINVNKLIYLPFIIIFLNYIFIQIVIVLLLLSIYNSYIIIDTMRFSTLDPDKLIEQYEDRSYSDYLLYYRKDIIDSIKENRKNGDKKAEHIGKIIKMILRSLISLFLYLFFVYGYIVYRAG